MRNISLASAALLALIGLTSATGTARAAQVSVNFEASPGSGYDLYYGATWTTAQSLSPSHSVQLSVPAVPPDQQQLVRIIPPSGFTLGSTAGAFSAYLPSGGGLVPYMEFGVDANHNGIWDPASGDALVIAFISGAGSYPTATWFGTGLDQSTMVQVVDGRPGLTAGTYDAGGTQNTLASLAALPLGDGSGLTWGDLPVLRAYVAVGLWPGVTSYTAYVDNMTLSQIPEPASMAVLGSALIGFGVARRRRA